MNNCNCKAFYQNESKIDIPDFVEELLAWVLAIFILGPLPLYLIAAYIEYFINKRWI